MSSADGEATEHEGTPDVPTQRGGSYPCGHPIAPRDHRRDDGDSRASRRPRGGLSLSDQLVVALRRGG